MDGSSGVQASVTKNLQHPDLAALTDCTTRSSGGMGLQAHFYGVELAIATMFLQQMYAGN